VDCERKITLATIGRGEVSKGSRNPPLWIIICLLAECPTRLSTRRRSANLCFSSLRFTQVDSGIFPTNTCKAHSFIPLINSLPPAEIIDLLNFGFTFFTRVECESFPLFPSSSNATYMMGGYSCGKTLVRFLCRSSESFVRSNSKYPWGLFVASRYALNKPLLSSGVPDSPDRKTVFIPNFLK